ncbi:MAG TPA: hypothetical protein VKX28_31130 [Xanthobacteraceae bacterium]|nr:hypothetical protein [Xanthobacteraceae bacterium]
MTGKKDPARDELDRIEDALVDAIMNSPEAELRDEIKARGENPDKIIASVDATISGAKAAGAKLRMERAKSELQAWRAGKGKIVAFDRATMKAKLDRMRARDPEFASKMMAAARNGEGLSESDLEGFLEDLARLERLEDEGGGE